MDTLHKHKKYGTGYRPYDYYWGLGIEHETYIQTSKTTHFHAFAHSMHPERYSVRYYNAYRQQALMEVFQKVFDARGSLEVPVLINSHTFLDTDICGEHVTTYDRQPKRNPRFNGTTIHRWATQRNKWLQDEYERSYTWDGDTVEFMTQRFYKTTVDAVLRELCEIEDSFVSALQTLPAEGVFAKYGPLTLTSTNHPWASYDTNSKNIAMFNNGTIHVNCTLPTRLDWYCRPMRFHEFRAQHQRLARLIQWMEPFWIAVYGSGDPFAAYDSRFAAGSQRLAVSRYIGLGTFDTETMPRGKINQIARDLSAIPWYQELYANTAYVPIDVIGLDINFNKHWSHGLELRFFDQMPREHLRTVMLQLVQIMDASLTKSVLCPNARHDVRWHSMATDAMYHGLRWKVQPGQMEAICQAFGVACHVKEPIPVQTALETIVEELEVYRGLCWKKMVSTAGSRGCCC